MAPTYATTAELRDHLGLAPGDPDPANAARYLRTASGLVSSAIIGAVYRVDDSGVPVDPTIAAACRDATLIQAEAWIVTGLDPALGASQVKRTVKSKSASNGGLSVTYDEPDPHLVLVATGQELVPDAYVPLRINGLLTTAVQQDGIGRPDVYLTGPTYSGA